MFIFTKVNLLSGIVCLLRHFENSFWSLLDLTSGKHFLLPSSEWNVARFSGLFFDWQFRFFNFSESNSYLDTEIAIISLRFGGLEITLVWFSPLVTLFESPKLYYKSHFARHFNAVSKLWLTGKCMYNIKSIGAFVRLYCFLENCWNLQQFRE